jgi:hypothetical protein
MKPPFHFSKSVALFAVTAVTTVSFQTPIFAANPLTSEVSASDSSAAPQPNLLQPTGTLQLAQLTGTCRRVNRAVPVYESASTTSTIVANLPGSSIVRLAANTGTNGLIQINSPVNGYLATNNLSPQVPCPGGGDPPPPGDLLGTCRRLNYPAPVRKEASFTSPVVTNLAVGTVVRLAANGGTNGFILIDSPANGFVEARNLSPKVPCPTTTPPADRCRQVLNPPEGLVIRREPNTSSAVVGGVAQGARVTLTANPPTRRTDSVGRIWIEVESPNRGWVSNGFPNNPSNLVFCR